MDSLQRSLRNAQAKHQGLLADRAAGRDVTDYAIVNALQAVARAQDRIDNYKQIKLEEELAEASLSSEERKELEVRREAERVRRAQFEALNEAEIARRRREYQQAVDAELEAAKDTSSLELLLRALPWAMLLVGAVWVAFIRAPVLACVIGFLFPWAGVAWLLVRFRTRPLTYNDGAYHLGFLSYLLVAPLWGIGGLLGAINSSDMTTMLGAPIWAAGAGVFLYFVYKQDSARVR